MSLLIRAVKKYGMTRFTAALQERLLQHARVTKQLVKYTFSFDRRDFEQSWVHSFTSATLTIKWDCIPEYDRGPSFVLVGHPARRARSRALCTWHLR